MALAILTFIALLIISTSSAIVKSLSDFSTKAATTPTTFDTRTASNQSLGVQYSCNGDRFGRNLSPKSCLQAWSFIPVRITMELSFGERDDGCPYDVGLPKRYLSCKALTAPNQFLAYSDSRQLTGAVLSNLYSGHQQGKKIGKRSPLLADCLALQNSVRRHVHRWTIFDLDLKCAATLSPP